MAQTWSLLSVTDLHYASPDTNYADDAKDLGSLDAVRDSVFTAFYELLQAFPREAFDLVAVCGDITTRGQEEGLRHFETGALPRLIDLVCRPQAVCVVPGNHDVVWRLDSRSPRAFDERFKPYAALVSRHQITTCLIPQGSITSSPNTGMQFRQPAHGPLHVDHDRKVIACTLNSALRCGELNPRMVDEVLSPLERYLERQSQAAGAAPEVDLVGAVRGHLIRDVAHVTQAQQKLVRDDLRALQGSLGRNWSDYLRVGILHHHLVPFTNQAVEHRGYELLVDASHVLQLFAEFDFDLVLTGHKHQPYIERHVAGDRQILLVGGPSVGGAAVQGASRGLRIIDVDETADSRRFKVVDIPCLPGSGRFDRLVAERRGEARPLAVPRPETSFERRAREVGYSYREIASITVIDLDGDARRVIECEDFRVEAADSDRARFHPVSLPPTSGTLAVLRARGRGFGVRIDPPLPVGSRLQNYSTRLVFDQPIGVGGTADYRYQWYAVNAFALDRDQFDSKYGHGGKDTYEEFTHFRTLDPTRELTVAVQFPPGYKPGSLPRLRVARPEEQKHSRDWEIDDAAQKDLERAHALRYYESLNIAALRVSQPSPALSYGIEWEVPDGPQLSDANRAVVDEFWRRWKNERFREDSRRALIKVLEQLVAAMRLGFAPKWSGPLDASLMWLDRTPQGTLVTLAAVQERTVSRFEQLMYETNLRFGEGIAGRALKSNRVRVYVAPEGRSAADEPNYYTPLAGTPAHQVVVSLPVHAAETDARFDENAAIYERMRPYAVLSIGSERTHCPLSNLRNPEQIPALLRFQHKANALLFDHLQAIVDRPEVDGLSPTT